MHWIDKNAARPQRCLARWANWVKKTWADVGFENDIYRRVWGWKSTSEVQEQSANL